MTKYLKQLILALTIFSSANTWAVCTNEDLTGFWDYLVAGDEGAVQCSLRFDGKKSHYIGLGVIPMAIPPRSPRLTALLPLTNTATSRVRFFSLSMAAD